MRREKREERREKRKEKREKRKEKREKRKEKREKRKEKREKRKEKREKRKEKREKRIGVWLVLPIRLKLFWEVTATFCSRPRKKCATTAITKSMTELVSEMCQLGETQHWKLVVLSFGKLLFVQLRNKVCNNTATTTNKNKWAFEDPVVLFLEGTDRSHLFPFGTTVQTVRTYSPFPLGQEFSFEPPIAGAC